MNYNEYIAQIANNIVVPSSDANFQVMIPGMIDYAEGRCYRDLDLLVTRVTTTTALSSGDRNLTIPSSLGYYRVIENVSVMGVGQLSSNGNRNPVLMVSRDFIDNIYPSGQLNTGLPLFSAMTSDTTMIFGPSPDAGYAVEMVGVIQPTPLSNLNNTTFLTNYLPDLFIAASMVFGSAYERDFGAESDNPKMSGSWEDQYNKLFTSANVQTLRQKYQSAGWTSAQPSPIATPPRA